MQQHPHYAATVELLGGHVKQLACTVGSTTRGQVQIIQRRLGPVKLAWIPRGPVWADGVDTSDRLDILHRLHHHQPKGTMRLVTPGTKADTVMLRDMSYREVAKSQSFALLDLTLPPEARLAAQHGKWRNRLRHAQAAKLHYETRRFDPQKDLPLLRLDALQRRERRYRALPPGFTQAWATTNDKAAQLFLTHTQGEMVAFVLVLIHAPSASYHIGWSNQSGRLHSCHNLLLWRASSWLAQRGIKTLDLGLIDEVTIPGLTRFKMGIGAERHATGPTMLALPQLSLPKLWRRAA